MPQKQTNTLLTLSFPFSSYFFSLPIIPNPLPIFSGILIVKIVMVPGGSGDMVGEEE